MSGMSAEEREARRIANAVYRIATFLEDSEDRMLLKGVSETLFDVIEADLKGPVR